MRFIAGAERVRKKLARPLFKRSLPGGLRRHTVRTCIFISKPVTDAETSETIAQHCGVVFQDPDQQFCMLTVEDEIAFGLENLQVPREEMTEKIDAVLEKLRITHLKKNNICTVRRTKAESGSRLYFGDGA